MGDSWVVRRTSQKAVMMDRCISAPADSLSVTGCMTARVPLLVCASAKGSIRPDVTAIKPSPAFNSLNGSKLGNNQPDRVTLTSAWAGEGPARTMFGSPGAHIVHTPSSNQLIESNTRSFEGPRSGQMAGDEMLACVDRFRHQLRLVFRANRLRQWAARSEAATGGRLDRIGNVTAQYDDLPATARNRFRNRRQ